MIFDKVANTSIVTNESMEISTFITKLNEAYPKLKNDHIIINLFSLNKLLADDLLELLPLSDTHRKTNKSFVIVTNTVSYDSIPIGLEIVPTLKEAHDLIEMEEIERDLNI